MKRIALIIFTAIFIASSSLLAVPASPHPVQIVQPDGSVLNIYLKGDEYFRYKITLDGYLIVKDAQGIYNYAKMDVDGKIVSTGIKANDMERRKSTEIRHLKSLTPFPDLRKLNSAQRAKRIAASNTETKATNAYPLTGSPKSLVILVNFSDKSFVTPNPREAFTKLLNEKDYSANGGTGSAKDYFRDASNGAFDPQFDVVGPFTLPKTTAFYGENVNEQDKNPRQMVIDACELADKAGIDFAQYDTDNDGIVDNIFIYYAGHNEAENGGDDTVWPHRWSLANYNSRFDRKIVYDYACTSELRGRSGSNMCGIGTFAHEFGHVLGLPDYYATDNSTHHTLDDWNIMDGGAYLNSGRTPPTYSAYDRFFLNWLVPIELQNPSTVTLHELSASNKAYLITQHGNHNLNGANPTPKEFFTLENRQKTGWDSYLPGSGMLITRINYNPNTWGMNGPNNTANAMGYDIIEADGIANSSSMSGDPFPGTAKVTHYDPTLRDGTKINKPITYIEEKDGVISFRFKGGGDVPTIEISSSFNEYNTIQGTASAAQSFSIKAKMMEDDIKLEFFYSSHYELSLTNNQATEWTKTISLAPVDGSVDSTIVYVRYNPNTPSYGQTHSEKLLISSQHAEKKEISISGKSTRKVYITPPVANTAEDLTPYSFIANWDLVKDNTKNTSGYYVSIYSTAPGESTKSEGFDNGLTAPPAWKITATSQTNSSLLCGKKTPALQFNNSNEYIQTELYPLAIKQLSFYHKSVLANNSWLTVEGLKGTDWTVIDKISINGSSSGVQSYNMSADNNYRQFRLTYLQGGGSLVIDDIEVVFDQKIDFITSEKWTTSNRDTLLNLIPNCEYHYKVKASDKSSLFGYENITDFSNTITVTTLADTDMKRLKVNIQSGGKVTVILPEVMEVIYVYNSLGQKILEVSENKDTVDLHLPTGQFYILKAGTRITKIIL